MKIDDLTSRLAIFDRQCGSYVFTRCELAAMFPSESDEAMEKSIKRMRAMGVLYRVSKGVYINPYAKSRNRFIAEAIAHAMRRGQISYVSLESILSEYGLISQVPISYLTVMTTGRSGIVKTTHGTIEFTHTKRSREDIMARTMERPKCPLRIATQWAAVEDLRRVGRNLNMLDFEQEA